MLSPILRIRENKVVLNVKHSSWTNAEVGVLQESILGLLFFLIYINDLSDGLNIKSKIICG